MTVSGFTITNALAHCDHQRRRASQKRRSQGLNWGPGVLTFEDADLLPQGDELQSQVMSGAEKGPEPREKSQKKPDHGPSLHDTVHGKAGSASR